MRSLCLRPGALTSATATTPERPEREEGECPLWLLADQLAVEFCPQLLRECAAWVDIRAPHPRAPHPRGHAFGLMLCCLCLEILNFTFDPVSRK